MNQLDIYTDGSCHTQLKIGAWGAILILNDREISLSGIATHTTHNRMELEAVIHAIQYIKDSDIETEKINVFTDSQYVMNLNKRKARFERQAYLTGSGNPVRNADLIKTFYNLTNSRPVHLVKVVAHQKQGPQVNHNRRVDKLVRKILRHNLKGE